MSWRPRPAFYLLLPLFLSACLGPPQWRRRADVLLRDASFPRPAGKEPRCLTDAILAQGLRAAVHSAAFAEVWDYGPLYGVGCPSAQAAGCLPLIGRLGPQRHPQLDLSVIAFNRPSCAQAVAKATVVFDRSHPEGLAGRHDPKTLDIVNIRFHSWDEARWNGGRFTLARNNPAAAAELVPGSAVAWESPYAAQSVLNAKSAAAGATDFMSPWPASVFKLMVATRILKLVDSGKSALGEPVTLETAIPLPPHELMDACPAEPRTLTLRQALETMLQWSGNCATSSLVRFLHTQSEVVQSPQLDGQGYPVEAPTRSNLNALLAELGLATLQMNRTSERSGRWGNPNDNYDLRTASVANNPMTSWDTARLLWLYDELPQALRPRWEVAPGQPVNADFLSPKTRGLLRQILSDSYSGSGLVNNRVCAQQKRAAAADREPALGPPPEPGLPALLSAKWVASGKLRTPFLDYPYAGVVDEVTPRGDDYSPSGDLSACQQQAEVIYQNKAGLTNVAGSSVGIVRGIQRPRRRFSRHYIVSFFSTLGTRYADGARMQAVGLSKDAARATHVSTTQAVPILGANLDAWLALWLE